MGGALASRNGVWSQLFIHSLHFSRGGERSKILPQACARSIGLTIALLGSAAFAGAFPAVSSATLSFHPANNQSVGGGPNSVAVADLNRDGKPDLATANRDTNDGSVLLRGGDGPVPTANNVSVGRGALLPLSLSATPTTMASSPSSRRLTVRATARAGLRPAMEPGA